jgi:hypothetical protein
MLKHGFRVSKFDECVFLWKQHGKVTGVVGFHVDDGILAGNASFWTAMESVSKDLQFGSRKKSPFKYCGVRITQHKDFSIELDQEQAIDMLEPMALNKKRKAEELLTPTEVTDLRGRIGSLLYLTGNTRPLECYIVSHIAGYVTEATVEHSRKIDAAIYHCKATKDIHLKYYPYSDPSVKEVLYTFHDSNFKVERGGGSQMGLISVLGPPLDSKGTAFCSILRFNSKRAKRVAHSTLTAETLAATQGLDQNHGTRDRLLEFNIDTEGLLLTDCRSLFDGLYSMTAKVGEMLVPDFFELREALMPWRCAEAEDYESKPTEMWWIPTETQLADNATKVATKSNNEFLAFLRDSQFTLPRYERPRLAQRGLKLF